MDFWNIITIIIIIFCFIEILTFVWIRLVRKYFPWLITEKDEHPKLSKDGLARFIPNGFDPELGWVRKPNTSHYESGKNGRTRWSINSNGSRTNPSFENKQSVISCYGDSFTFARQVNDNETWEHHMSKKLGTNVLNFGVGNYGADQSLLRLKREFLKNRTKIVILGVVPDTVSRILSCWKHYYEYGNTFAFKPRFTLKNNNLNLIKNIINEETRFSKYFDYLSQIQEHDYFYRAKFKKEKIHFPYSFTIFKNTRRNFSIIWWVTIIRILSTLGSNTSKISWNPMRTIMRVNLEWRVRLYKNEQTTTLLKEIIREFVSYSKEQRFTPVFVFLPQKDDLLFIKKNYNFYDEFVKSLSEINSLNYIDITKNILNDSNLDNYYSDDNEYGGHYSKLGNQKIAEIIHNELSKLDLV